MKNTNTLLNAAVVAVIALFVSANVSAAQRRQLQLQRPQVTTQAEMSGKTLEMMGTVSGKTVEIVGKLSDQIRKLAEGIANLTDRIKKNENEIATLKATVATLAELGKNTSVAVSKLVSAMDVLRQLVGAMSKK